MGLTTTITVDGKPIERDSIEAFEFVASEYYKIAAELGELQTIVPARIRDDGNKAVNAVREVASRANRVAEEARRRERLGQDSATVLLDALDEADFAEGR